MRKLLNKIGLKTKVLFLIFGALAVGAGVYGIVRAGTANNDTFSIDYQDGDVAHILYTMTNNTTGAVQVGMCTDTSMSEPAGQTNYTATELGSSDSRYYYILGALLATVPGYDGGSGYYDNNQMLSGTGYDSWYDLLVDLPQFTSASAYDTGGLYNINTTEGYTRALYRLGHKMIVRTFTGGYGALWNNQDTVSDYSAGILDTVLAKLAVNVQYQNLAPNTYRVLVAAGNSGYQPLTWVEARNAWARVKKTASDTGSVLSGATYTINGTSATTDASGYTAYVTVPLSGSFTFQETSAPAGYALDSTTYTCTANGGDTPTWTCTGGTVTYTYGTGQYTGWVGIDIAMVDEPEAVGEIKIKKVDSETGSTSGQGEASIDGAKFGVYRSADDVEITAARMTISGGTATTGKKLEVGDYYVKEISAGTGYKTNATRKNCSITTTNTVCDLTTDPFENDVVKGGVKITKNRETWGGTTAFSGVKFDIKDSNGTKVKTITTGSNGIATTGSNELPYGHYTLSEVRDAAVNGAYDLINDVTVNVTSDGTIVDAGVYTDELTDDPNVATVARNGSSSASNPSKTIEISANASVVDRVTYSGLTNGLTYKIEAKLYAVSGARLIDSQSTEWTQSSETYKEVTFSNINTGDFIGETLSVSAELFVKNGSEWIKLGEYNKNLSDANEQVTVDEPALSTTATTTGMSSNKILGVGTTKIVDTITMRGLVNGTTYTVKGQLVDENGNVITLSDGSTTKTETYTMASATGTTVTTTMELTFDSSNYIGKKIVVYESLYNGNDLVAEHKNLNDTNQTVTVTTPTVGTVAKDSADGNNVIEPEAGQAIVDTVSYTGLVSGQSYKLVGTLMDKATGQALKIDGEPVTVTKTFTASGANGSVDMTFSIDATDLPGVELVVYERLYFGSNLIAKHENINDAAQYIKVRARIGTSAVDSYDGDQKIGVGNVTVVDTIEYEGLTSGTKYVMVGKMMDKKTGEPLEATTKLAMDDEEYLKIVAMIAKLPTALTPAQWMSLLGITVDEENEVVYMSGEVVGFTVFTVGETGTEGTNGEAEMRFTFSSRGLDGKDLVVFEELYKADELAAKLVAGEEPEPDTWHEDLEDKSQTVTVLEPEIQTTAVDALDQDKELALGGTVVITDRVEYRGLTEGTEYTLVGVLMDKSTGKVVEWKHGGETEKKMKFVATGETGVVEMTFEVDTTDMSGTEVVVFEELYIEDIMIGEDEVETEDVKIAEHKDIEDQKQTVWVKIAPPETGLFTKELGGAIEGAKNRGVFIAVGAIVVVSVGVVVGLRFGKRKKFGW